MMRYYINKKKYKLQIKHKNQLSMSCKILNNLQKYKIKYRYSYVNVRYIVTLFNKKIK